MKVIISSRAVFPFHGVGGMQLYVYQLAKHLTKQGVEVKIVTYPPEGKCDVDYQNSGKYTFLPVDSWKFRGVMPEFLNYQYFNWLLADHLRDEDFDVLHACGITSAAYLRREKERKPVVVQAFGNEPLKRRTGIGKLKALLWKNVLKHCMKAADGIASQGGRQTDNIVALYGVEREKVFWLPSGIDYQLIQGYLSSRKIAREELGVRNKDFLILSVGRLLPYKGVDHLLEAAKILRSQLGPLKVLVIGAGPDEARIESLIKKYDLQDVIIRRKDVEERELFEYYGLADVFVMASSNEGFPLVTLEAAACGLPIVATNIGENPQVVRDKENGYLIPPCDSRAIASAIWQVYNRSDRKQMGEISREIAKQYDWSIIASMAIAEYERLVRVQNKRTGK